MKNTVIIGLFAFGALLTACKPSAEEVNVYSARHYRADEQLFEKFTEATGIRVNVVKANADQLINRLEMEGDMSPADLLMAADAGRLVLAREKGLLQALQSPIIKERVPEHLRDRQGYWTGFTRRARVIAYHKERVNPSELSTYEALAEPVWKGRVLVRSSQAHYNQTLMASIVAALGKEEASAWAGQLVKNMARKPGGNDRDQVKAIVAGEGDVAIINTYYMGLLLNSANEEERAVAREVALFFPNQEKRGTHVNVSAIGLTAHAPNAENAQKLVEFLLSEEAQKTIAEVNHEYPVNPTVEWPPLLQSWGRFEMDLLPLDELGKHLETAQMVFHEAGWE